MKLTTVIASVNNNPAYYLFIPKQIAFWSHFNIKFLAIFVGSALPAELEAYKENIVLWSRTADINSVYIGQMIRIFYPALLTLPEDELVMITDMDMLPTNDQYYKSGLEAFTKQDFIYYRKIDGNQIYMCYNAAHPSTWGSIFNIKTEDDIEATLRSHYTSTYDGRPGAEGWCTDQVLLYSTLTKYPHLKVLNRPIKRLEVNIFQYHLRMNHTNFVGLYDDFHAHRNFSSNESLILNAEAQLLRLP
jgi:hypothetical protein